MTVDPSECTIYEGDARDMTELADNSAELVLTSPPYNLGVEYDAHDDELTPDEYESLLREAFTEAARVLTPDGRMAVVVGVGVGQPLLDIPRIVKRCAAHADFELRDEHIWFKGESESSSAWGSWRSASCPREIFVHEHVLVFHRESPGRDVSGMGKTIPKAEFMQYVKSVWHVRPETNAVAGHPAAFPPEIPYRILRLHSFEGDRVVDPFCGTGTTCAVAAALDRNVVGYDISSEYVEAARKRCAEFDISDATVGVEAERTATQTDGSDGDTEQAALPDLDEQGAE